MKIANSARRTAIQEGEMGLVLFLFFLKVMNTLAAMPLVAMWCVMYCGLYSAPSSPTSSVGHVAGDMNRCEINKTLVNFLCLLNQMQSVFSMQPHCLHNLHSVASPSKLLYFGSLDTHFVVLSPDLTLHNAFCCLYTIFFRLWFPE